MSDTATPETDPRDLKIAEQAKGLAELTQANKQLREENRQLKERIERLEALLATRVDAKSSKPAVFTENYSLDRNNLGRQGSDKKRARKSTGRKRSEAKAHLVSDIKRGKEACECVGMPLNCEANHRIQSQTSPNKH